MKEFKDNEKISLIKKYYKKNQLFLELHLINYENHNLYICINEIEKDKSYRLSWFDLDEINDKNIEKYICCQYISSKIINMIRNDFSKYIVSSQYQDEFLTDKDTVVLNANIKTECDKSINVSFKKYLPKQLSHLANLIIFIFRNMPKSYETILFEILAKLTNTTEKYEYKKEFEFDLFNGDIDKLFSYQICERGKKYYEESKVKFLEKIDDRYFAVVEGTQKYLTIIKYDEKESKMQVYCSCPCEFYCKHMYAVILAIRNNKFNPFYKIMYNNPNQSILERIMDFDYLLCVGIIEQNFEIINNNQFNWKVLEDSKDEKLTKQIKILLMK